eukprot:scaffold473_cov132-Cylindrotheca_fusiformis.AAC.4
MLDLLPAELVRALADYLNPAERHRLSATNRHQRGILPTPLCIRVISKNCNSCLKRGFYVSTWKNPERMLLLDDTLKFSESYVFWSYDYSRENRVYLSKHGTRLINGEHRHRMYTLGLRPKSPSQYLRIRGGRKGTTVKFGSNIGLDIGGESAVKHRADSRDRMFISAQSLTIGSLWYTVQHKWGVDEQLQLVRCQDFTPSDNVDEQELIVHAIPDVKDKGYCLYSPKSLKDGRATSELYHASITFYFWITDGLIFFEAFESLSFSFAVPILEEDYVDDTSEPYNPLAVLLKKNSSRWWAIKNYMAHAADVKQGRAFNMESFLRSSKDHEDHSVIFDMSRNLVFIQVEAAVVDNKFPDFPKDVNAPWKFLLCGS